MAATGETTLLPSLRRNYYGDDRIVALEQERIFNEQDFAAVEACQAAMRSRGYRDGSMYVPAAHRIVEFNRWVREGISKPE